jgi:hypothetical protein
MMFPLARVFVLQVKLVLVGELISLHSYLLRMVVKTSLDMEEA